MTSDEPRDGDPLGEASGDPDDRAAFEAVQARRIRDVRAKVEDLGRRHTELAVTVSEGIAPELAELHKVTRSLHKMAHEELGELRAAVKELFTEQEKAKNPPVDWPALTAEQAAEQWPILAKWVGRVLVPWYELTRAELPDCWAMHRPVAVELSWLRSAHVQDYLPHSHPHLAGEWHVRWRPAVIARIGHLINEAKCRPGEHMIAKEDSPSLRRPTTPAAAPAAGTPRPLETPPLRQLAEPRHWWPFYQRAFHADLARRTEEAAAPEPSWTPEPPPVGA
jgi:hypothetical protein